MLKVIEENKGDIVGIIGLPTAEHVRFSAFYAYLNDLVRPQGWKVRPCESSSAAANRNVIGQYALDVGAKWVFYLDDDQEFMPGLLTQLLKRDVDIVCALYVRRDPPFTPIVFDRKRDDGFHFVRFLRPGDQGLVEVEAVGAGALLLRRTVLERVRQPWFTLGQIVKDQWSDDIDFCRKARAAGFKIHVDLDAPIGHMLAVSVWPVRENDGTWWTYIVRAGTMIAKIPAAAPPPMPGASR